MVVEVVGGLLSPIALKRDCQRNPLPRHASIMVGLLINTPSIVSSRYDGVHVTKMCAYLMGLVLARIGSIDL
jgi:hypothetical protein